MLEQLFGNQKNTNEHDEQEAARFAAQAKTLEEALALQQQVWREEFDAAKSGDPHGRDFLKTVATKEAVDRRVRELQAITDKRSHPHREAA